MDDYEVDFDVSCFKNQPTEAGYLTKVTIDENNKIVARFTQIEKNNKYKEIIVKMDNTPTNYDYILAQRYYTIIKLIEINDARTYDKIIDLNNKLDDAKLKYRFYNIVSFLCLTGPILCGFAINNYSADVQNMLPVITASVGLMLMGLLSKYEYYKNYHFYDLNTPILTDCIDNESKKFIRVKS